MWLLLVRWRDSAKVSAHRESQTFRSSAGTTTVPQQNAKLARRASQLDETRARLLVIRYSSGDFPDGTSAFSCKF